MASEDDTRLRRAAFEKNKNREEPRHRFISHISVITTLSVFSVALSVFTASETLLYQEDNLAVITGNSGLMSWGDLMNKK